MQLRWSALIALWTILSGPVLSDHAYFSREPAVKKPLNRQDAKKKVPWRSWRLGGSKSFKAATRAAAPARLSLTHP
jgi:hypothetical protein